MNEVVRLQPTRGRLLVRPDKKREMYGVLHIPKEAQKTLWSGVVLAKGPSWVDDKGKAHDIDVDVNERVLYRKWTGFDVSGDVMSSGVRRVFEIEGEEGVLEFVLFDDVGAAISKDAQVEYQGYKERDVYDDSETEIEQLPYVPGEEKSVLEA